MPWQTPSLREVRGLVRDNIHASLPGSDASIPNSVLRVLSDAQGGLCHLTLQYIDWLALQLLPDTAETEWLDRHGMIWLVNSDGSKGRKQAIFAEGLVEFTGTNGTVVPMVSPLQGAGVGYETTAEITIGTVPTEAPVRALDPGTIGNMAAGETLGTLVPGADGTVTVVEITGGVDQENDDDLRSRVLHRIQNPPMGGAVADYVTWALAVPGVTRAWAGAEQGPGTITVRFLMDELRAADDGWPNPSDLQTVHDYINLMRPVTVKDTYVVAPIKVFIDVTVLDLVPDTAYGEVEASLRDMMFRLAAPGQTIYAAWISYAIMNAPTVQSFTMTHPTNDYVMPSLGHMAVLGTLLFEETPPPVAP